MARYVVTGVGGFVGAYFCRLIKEREDNPQILGIDRSDAAPFVQEGFSYLKMDLLNEPEALLSAFDTFKPDYVLHLAAVSSVFQSWQNPTACLTSNLGMYTNLLEAVRKAAPGAAVLSVGSSEVYGSQPEEAMPLKETSPLNPNNPYGISRVAQENITRMYVDTYGLRIMTSRSFNHIGPGQKEQFVIPSFVSQLVKIAAAGKSGEMMTGNIEVMRDFSDVRDVVEAYRLILKNGKAGTVYNVCSGTATKLREIIERVAVILGITVTTKTDPSRVRPQDTRLVVGDHSRITKELGWTPAYNLDRTLRDMVEDFKQRS